VEHSRRVIAQQSRGDRANQSCHPASGPVIVDLKRMSRDYDQRLLAFF
jgi:hypothetical protein